MKKVNFEQGSDKWLQWRKGLITATDASCILGKNPYSTPYKCWQEKLDKVPPKTVNKAMERGRRDEPIARALFIKETGINMIPCCIESEKYNFLGASLDGLSECEQYILEVKSQRPVKEIPEFHLIQILHQMLCSDGKVKKAFYVSHWEGSNIIFNVEFDPAWALEYIQVAKEFWRCIVFEEVPSLTRNDYRSMEENETWQNNAKEYQHICSQIKYLEEAKEKYRQKIIDTCGDENCIGGGIRVLKKSVKGRIDYEAIPELKIIDIEQYRKKPNYSWTITLDQN